MMWLQIDWDAVDAFALAVGQAIGLPASVRLAVNAQGDPNVDVRACDDIRGAVHSAGVVSVAGPVAAATAGEAVQVPVLIVAAGDAAVEAVWPLGSDPGWALVSAVDAAWLVSQWRPEVRASRAATVELLCSAGLMLDGLCGLDPGALGQGTGPVAIPLDPSSRYAAMPAGAAAAPASDNVGLWRGRGIHLVVDGEPHNLPPVAGSGDDEAGVEQDIDLTSKLPRGSEVFVLLS